MMSQNFNRRFSPNRRKTRVDAWFSSDLGRQRVVVLDVSFEGMKLKMPKAVPPGTAGTVDVFGNRIATLVHWWKDGSAGVRLAERLDRDLLVALENAADELADYR